MDETEKLKNDLKEILDFDESKGNSKILDYHFDLIKQSNTDGDYRSASFNVLRMQFLHSKLKKLKKEKLSEFKKIRNDLFSQKDTDGFYGFRFEMDMAHSLLVKEVDFQKIEHPDFVIIENEEEIFLECTSVRSRGGNNTYENLKKKVTDSIETKESKPYANNKTALVLDVTNLFYNVKPEDWQKFYNDLMSFVEEHFNREKYGAIIIFTTVYSQKHYKLNVTFKRIDSNKIDDKLEKFLNNNYPEGKSNIKGPGFPREA